MHDPMTVAFEVRSPFKKPSHLSPGYRPVLVTIWHRDPETDGDDDSCGWAYVNLTAQDAQWSEQRAETEWRSWFSAEWGDINLAQAEDLVILSLAWLEVRFRHSHVPRHRPLTAWDLGQVVQCLVQAGDSLSPSIRRAKQSKAGLADLLLLTLRIYATRRRPWWQRPRWHVGHWRLQVPAWQYFNRCAWSRCTLCGGRFQWGESPVSGSWHGDGPSFLRPEKNIWHMQCDRSRAEQSPPDGATQK